MQPTILFPDNEGYQTVPAAPIDLPPIGDYSLDVPLSLAYIAACTSGFFMAISLGLLSRAVKISIYHSIASSSLFTAILSTVLLLSTSEQKRWVASPSTKHTLLLCAIIAISLLAQLFQALALQRKSPRQLSLFSFVQPIFSTGFQTIFLDHTIDVLPLAGSVLIAANM
jgi:drug/metabolite transporter (DMT)-like permease